MEITVERNEPGLISVSAIVNGKRVGQTCRIVEGDRFNKWARKRILEQMRNDMMEYARQYDTPPQQNALQAVLAIKKGHPVSHG